MSSDPADFRDLLYASKEYEGTEFSPSAGYQAVKSSFRRGHLSGDLRAVVEGARPAATALFFDCMTNFTLNMSLDEALLDELFSIDFGLLLAPKVKRAFLKWFRALFTSHIPSANVICLQLLRKLAPREVFGSEGESTVIQTSPRVTRLIHAAVKSILDAIPTAHEIILDSIRATIPAAVLPNIFRVSFLHNVFQFAFELPGLRRSLLVIALCLLIELDAAAAASSSSCEEEGDNFLSKGAPGMEEDVFVADLDGLLAFEDGLSSASDDEPTQVSQSVTELDDCMVIFLQYIDSLGPHYLKKTTTESPALTAACDDLLAALDRVVFGQTDSKLVQFAALFAAGRYSVFRIKLAKLFLTKLDSDADYSRSERELSLWWLASLFGRSNTYTADDVAAVLNALSAYSLGFIEQDWACRHYYASLSAMMFILIHRHSLLFFGRVRGSEDYDLLIEYLTNLGFDSIAKSPGNPFLRAPPSIVAPFLSVAKDWKILDIDELQQRNGDIYLEDSEYYKFPLLFEGLVLPQCVEMIQPFYTGVGEL